MDFCGSSDDNKVVEAIGLGVDVGDIAAGQRLGSKMSMSLLKFAEEEENGVSALARMNGKSGPIKCSEAGVPRLQPCTFRRA
jgi:hypothetical protein